MRAAILTREYPPDVYGGAGVHVDFLVRELARLIDVDVHCMGGPRDGAVAHSEDDPRMPEANSALRILSADLAMTASVGSAQLVHSHTWYANMAGHWAKLLYDVPHVVTAHSLEPQRPWKAEQLGGGYQLSSWAEKTAYESADAVVAVSNGMREDVLTNADYWDGKIGRNVARDADTSEQLAEAGWTVLRYWEHLPATEVAEAIAEEARKAR